MAPAWGWLGATTFPPTSVWEAARIPELIAYLCFVSRGCEKHQLCPSEEWRHVEIASGSEGELGASAPLFQKVPQAPESAPGPLETRLLSLRVSAASDHRRS